MSSKVLVTTPKDLSSDLFNKHGWEIIQYGLSAPSDHEYEVAYYRDPFNDDSISEKMVEESLKQIHGSRSIDNIKTYAEMLSFEDKYNQYKIYHDLMPKTFLPSRCYPLEKDKYLAKKRISQRSKDIIFDLSDDRIDDNYIIQEIIEIDEELRAYIIFGKVIRQATIKSSKINGKVKVVGKRNLNEAELGFCQAVADRTNLDFVGIDLAVLKNGEIKLIEVNRSPQFLKYAELYGEALLSGILDL